MGESLNYEKPELIPLDKLSKGPDWTHGAICGPGSGATYQCQDGTSAAYWCAVGPGGDDWCDNGTTDQWCEDGAYPTVTCDLGSDD